MSKYNEIKETVAKVTNTSPNMWEITSENIGENKNFILRSSVDKEAVVSVKNGEIVNVTIYGEIRSKTT